MQHKLLINGELVSGEGEKQPVYNPATGDVLLEIAEASAEQVDAAVRAADAAFAEWGQTTPKVRAECLLKLADVIEENGQVFAELESRNCGKPLHSAFNDEIPAVVDVFRFFAGAAVLIHLKYEKTGRTLDYSGSDGIRFGGACKPVAQILVVNQ